MAFGAHQPSSVTGIVGHPVEDVVLDGISITTIATEQAAMDAAVPECEADYPRATMFGDLPARGLFARHVDGLDLRGVRFAGGDGDARPAIVTDDVTPL